MVATKKNRFRPSFESLEDRVVPAVYNFQGGVSNSWSNGANWVDAGGTPRNSTPGATDDVQILAGKTCEFDVGTSKFVKSLTMYAGASLDLGKVTANALTLTVDSPGAYACATIGTSGATDTPATIRAQNNNPSSARNADIVFAQNVAFYKARVWMYAPAPVGGGADRLNKMTFKSRASFNDQATLEADALVGGAGLTAQMYVEPGAGKNVTLSDEGKLTISPLSTLHLWSGALWKNFFNSNVIDNQGTVDVSTSTGTKYECQPKIQGGKTTIRNGDGLKSHFVPGSGFSVYVWAGTGLDASGEAQTFESGDHITFLGDGVNTDPVTLYGDFVFDGATETFTVFAVAHPDDDDLSDWSPETGGSPINVAVNVRADDDENCSWTSISDTTNWAVDHSSGYHHATLDVDGAYSNSYGEFHVSTTGTTPSANDTVLLVSSSQSLSVSNLDHSYAGYAWGVWLPASDERGLIAGMSGGGGGGGGD